MKKYGGVISRVIIDYEIYRSISVVAMTTPETKELQNVRKSSGKVTANFCSSILTEISFPLNGFQPKPSM